MHKIVCKQTTVTISLLSFSVNKINRRTLCTQQSLVQIYAEDRERERERDRKRRRGKALQRQPANHLQFQLNVRPGFFPACLFPWYHYGDGSDRCASCCCCCCWDCHSLVCREFHIPKMVNRHRWTCFSAWLNFNFSLWTRRNFTQQQNITPHLGWIPPTLITSRPFFTNSNSTSTSTVGFSDKNVLNIRLWWKTRRISHGIYSKFCRSLM